MDEIHYFIAARLLKSSSYGNRQNRKRAHGFVVDALAVGWSEEQFKLWESDLWNTMEELQLDLESSPPLEGYLLDNIDEYVAKVLQERQTNAGKEKDATEDPTWRKDMNNWLKKHGYSNWGICQPTEKLLSSEWFHLLPNRERLTLAALMAVFPHKIGHDVSQQLGRSHDSADSDNLATLIPAGKVYLPEQD